jgi:hypothetical protein
MLGTVKLPVPELVCVAELVGELFGREEVVAVTEGLAAAECVRVGESAGVGDDVGVPVSADVGDAPGVEADPLGAAADPAAAGFDPLAPHALKPAPQMTAAMITAGTRDILMLQPSVK